MDIKKLLPIAKTLNDAGIKAIPYDTGGEVMVVAVYKNESAEENEYDAAIGPEGISVYVEGEFSHSVALADNPDYVAEVKKVFSAMEKTATIETPAKTPAKTDWRKRRIKRISSEFYNAEQSWFFEALWDFKGEKLRVIIRRNAVDFQSYLIVEIYEPTQRVWNKLTSKPIESAHCKCVSYVETKEQMAQRYGLVFEKDEEELLKKAALILNR